MIIETDYFITEALRRIDKLPVVSTLEPMTIEQQAQYAVWRLAHFPAVREALEYALVATAKRETPHE